MNKFDINKKILYLLGIALFIIIITFVLSIDNEKIDKKTTTTQNSNSTIEITKSPLSTPNEITENIQTTINIKPTLPLKEREDSWKNNGTGYLSLSQVYRKAFVKAVNNNDMTEIKFMLVENSNIYKKISAQINSLKNQKTQLDFKSSKLVQFSENGNKIFLEVSENIGFKKGVETQFNYKDYSIKYTLLVINQGLLITNVVDEI